MTPAEALARAGARGVDLYVEHDGGLGYRCQAGTMTPELRAVLKQHKAVIVHYLRHPLELRPRCDVCGLNMSSDRVSSICGRCGVLNPLVREAIRLGGRVVYPRSSDPRFDAWRRFKAQLTTKKEETT